MHQRRRRALRAEHKLFLDAKAYQSMSKHAKLLRNNLCSSGGSGVEKWCWGGHWEKQVEITYKNKLPLESALSEHTCVSTFEIAGVRIKLWNQYSIFGGRGADHMYISTNLSKRNPQPCDGVMIHTGPKERDSTWKSDSVHRPPLAKSPIQKLPKWYPTGRQEGLGAAYDSIVKLMASRLLWCKRYMRQSPAPRTHTHTMMCITIYTYNLHNIHVCTTHKSSTNPPKPTTWPAMNTSGQYGVDTYTLRICRYPQICTYEKSKYLQTRT